MTTRLLRDELSFDEVMSIHRETVVLLFIFVTRLRSFRNIEALASKVKHKLNILKTQDSKKYGGCELTIVAGNELAKLCCKFVIIVFGPVRVML